MFIFSWNMIIREINLLLENLMELKNVVKIFIEF